MPIDGVGQLGQQRHHYHRRFPDGCGHAVVQPCGDGTGRVTGKRGGAAVEDLDQDVAAQTGHDHGVHRIAGTRGEQTGAAQRIGHVGTVGEHDTRRAASGNSAVWRCVMRHARHGAPLV